MKESFGLTKKPFTKTTTLQRSLVSRNSKNNKTLDNSDSKTSGSDVLDQGSSEKPLIFKRYFNYYFESGILSKDSESRTPFSLVTDPYGKL